MDLDTFLSELARLERELGRGDENLASFQCDGCLRCASCMFCTDCADCYRCTHCNGCTRCTACSHCSGCERCHDNAYCRDCVRCQGSSYLVRCRDCVDCTYCYGCVGLIKKEFQILNVRYPRKEYFELTARLDEQWRARQQGAAPSEGSASVAADPSPPTHDPD